MIDDKAAVILAAYTVLPSAPREGRSQQWWVTWLALTGHAYILMQCRKTEEDFPSLISFPASKTWPYCLSCHKAWYWQKAVVISTAAVPQACALIIMSAILLQRAPVSLLMKLWKRCTGCSLVRLNRQVISSLIRERVELRASHYTFSGEQELPDQHSSLDFCLFCGKNEDKRQNFPCTCLWDVFSALEKQRIYRYCTDA